MDFAALVTTVLAVTTIVATGLTGLSYGITRTLRDSNGDLRHRIDEQAHALKERDDKILQLEAENTVLKRIVTGEVHWQALSEMLDQHHKESMQAWDEIKTSLAATMQTVHSVPRVAGSKSAGRSPGPRSAS